MGERGRTVDAYDAGAGDRSLHKRGVGEPRKEGVARIMRAARHLKVAVAALPGLSGFGWCFDWRPGAHTRVRCGCQMARLPAREPHMLSCFHTLRKWKQPKDTP